GRRPQGASRGRGSRRARQAVRRAGPLPLPRGGGEPAAALVAGGLVVLGLGALVFGYLRPLLGVVDLADVNRSMYASLVVWSLAGALFAVGLLAASPPAFSRRAILGTLALFAALGVAVVAGVD